ncbi:MAG: hypothetical protein CVV28_11750 [Methanobacteriales archaeon HGW-Methanobacteriales-1]|jgi:CDP-ribitol ribitolphosphotransferase|nr:MAG: hypothetical protein CVV28_11750 [Methanobacteriales archaeon HGW-Methanobacteriales-1]
MDKGAFFKIIAYDIMALFFYFSYLFPINSQKILLIMTHDESDEGNVGSAANYFKEKEGNLIFKRVTKENYNFKKNKNLFKNLFHMFIGVPYHMATSGTIFMDNVFLPFSSVRLKKNTRLIQLWHGTGALKKFGLDSEEGWIRDRAIKVNDNTTHFIVASKWMKEVYKTAFGVTYGVTDIGCPRTDLFFHEDLLSEKRAEFFSSFPALSSKKIILYAPTFRDDETVDDISINLDIPELMSKLDDNHVLGLRLHPHVSNKVDLDNICLQGPYGDRIFDFSHYGQLNTLLVCSDILITDYSSIIYEYALLGKQMIFYSYDLTKFEKLGRGFYDDYESMVPGPVVFKTQEIVDEINNPTEYDLDEFLAKYLENCDGHARARLYDLLALDGWG